MLVALMPYILCLRQERMRFITRAALVTAGIKNKALGMKETINFNSTVPAFYLLTNSILIKIECGHFIANVYILVL